MKVSLKLMKWYSDEAQWKLSLAELATKIGSQLGAVEETIDLSHKYDGVLIAQIVSCVPHPDSDHMHVCMIDDGGKAKDVARDANGHVQVVCGAPNVRAGLMVAWLPPGSAVPETFGKEPFVLGARELRGVMSNGMLASSRELDVNDDHSGILEIDVEAKPGDRFADVYNLGSDGIIDIENKMFTHRPDGFGNLGVAREIAGIQNLPFQSPDWYSLDVEMPESETHTPLTVKNEIPDLVPRYSALVIDGVQIKPSPVWLQVTLRTLGIRPINNVVDVTNYLMVLTGQPLHAFDYDKVASHTIVVRKPRKGEKLPLLDGRTIEPQQDAMLICDAEKPIGLGGMMGGANSEIDQNTTRIVLESATFDMFTIRRTSMHHGIFTDAVTRFSKGQSPLQTIAVLAKAAEEIKKLAGGTNGLSIDDIHLPKEMLERGSVHAPIATTAEYINARLGSTLSAEEMAVLLNNVEFTVETHGDQLVITAPFWRTDIEIAEDVVEEIGRMHGYENLPQNLPSRATSTASIEELDLLKTSVRDILARAGANEIQTYSFVPARLLQQVGQDKKHAFAIRNALSPDLEHYRMGITPSVLDKVHANIKAGYKEFALFEIGKVHIRGEDFVDCDGLPREYQTIAFVFASDNPHAGAAYYQAKHYLDYLMQELGVPTELRPIEHAPVFEIGRQIFAPFEQKRTSFVYAGEGEHTDFAGFLGEYRGQVVKNLKLPRVVAGFEIDLERLLQHKHARKYQRLLKFPATDQDVCLKVATDITYADLKKLVTESLAGDERLRITIAPLDIYKRQDDTGHKQITFRITLQHADRTLTTTEVNDMLDLMVQKVDAAIGVERI